MHVDNYEYEFDVNENGEILLWFKMNGELHSIGITEKDVRSFGHIFEMHN
ncbi:hypothetical protein ACIGHG_23630 [Bacillus sp. NPDC077411]